MATPTGLPHSRPLLWDRPCTYLYIFGLTFYLLVYHVYLPISSVIECLKRHREFCHQQPLLGSLGKNGRAKAHANNHLSQY
jgi:hypothetical protein